LLIAPSAIVIGVFGFYPLVGAFLLSLRDWRLVPGGFVGAHNYQRAFADPDLWQSLGVTFWYVAGTVPATLVLAYVVAELLTAKLRGLAAYRTLFFLPYIVSPVAAAAVWRWMLNPSFGLATALASRVGLHPQWLQEEAGIFAMLANALHLHAPKWAAGPSLALTCIIAATVWQNLGFAIVILLAGLAAVPPDVIEAARLDGARGWSLIRNVKLPMVSPTLFFLSVVYTIRAFQMYTQILVLSPDNRGGPAGTTRNITMYIVQSFYDSRERLGPGYGSAVAMLLFAMILALTLLQFRVLGRQVHYQ
jgi:multiple sugar transport system permease protein